MALDGSIEPRVSKAYIRLWESAGLGLIISWPSRVMYANQTGGAFCLTSALEGVFVPLRNEVLLPSQTLQTPADALGEYFATKWKRGSPHWLNEQDADSIDSILQEANLYPTLKVARTHLQDSHEAWVWVIVDGDESDVSPIFSGFSSSPLSGVLTWENSD